MEKEQEKKKEQEEEEEEDYKRYFPVIAPKDGCIAAKLRIGDEIFVSPNVRKEDFIYPHKYFKSLLCKIIKLSKDENNNLHFLVKFPSNEFGDVEVNDSFVKIKQFDPNEKKKKEKKKKETRMNTLRVIIGFCVICISIVFIYSILIFSISLIF